MNEQRAINFWRFIASLAMCYGAAFIGSFFTRTEITQWYAFLKKPIFTPPGWVFAPVWTALFFLMAVSLYLVWRRGLRIEKERMAFGLFIIHLIFNAFWSIVFFGFHEIFFALIVIIVLWIMIYSLIFQFYRINKFACYLLVPYLVWVSYASFLNFSLWLLNR